MPGAIADTSDLLDISAGETHRCNNLNGFNPPVIMGNTKVITTRIIMMVLFHMVNGEKYKDI